MAGNEKAPDKKASRSTFSLHTMGRIPAYDSNGDWFWIIGGGIIIACLVIILVYLNQ